MNKSICDLVAEGIIASPSQSTITVGNMSSPKTSRKRIMQASQLLNSIKAKDVERSRHLIMQISGREGKGCCTRPVNPSALRWKGLELCIIAAAGCDSEAILDCMLENEAPVNTSLEVTSALGKISLTPLHIAVDSGCHGNMALLMDQNADTNRLDSNGRSPLHIAIIRADAVAVRMLLSHGAKVQILDRQGHTALQLASRYGHVELVRALLEHNAQLFAEGQQGPSALHIAATEGHLQLLDLFLESRYLDVNTASEQGERTALHLACNGALFETVRFLIEQHKADINAKDSTGNTPLHYLLEQRYDATRMRPKYDFDAIAELLLNQGADPNACNSEGVTPLHLAARHGFHKVAERLLDKGAEAKAKNANEVSPMEEVPKYDVPMRQLFRRHLGLSTATPTPEYDSLRRKFSKITNSSNINEEAEKINWNFLPTPSTVEFGVPTAPSTDGTQSDYD